MACADSPTAGAFEVAGTIRHHDLEGGVYLIEVGDTARYQPLELDEPFRRDGLRVRATLRVVDAMTSAQAGTPVEVVRIEKTP
jgi:hypothetical protein